MPVMQSACFFSTLFQEILTFWLDRGVAGFRIDAVPHMYETGFEDEPLSNDSNAQSHEYGYLDHIYTKDQPETFQIIYQWRALIDEYSKKKGDYSRYEKVVLTSSRLIYTKQTTHNIFKY